VLLVAGILLDKAQLRHHAFQLFTATSDVRGVAPMEWIGYSGPWSEQYWIANFAQPIKVNRTIVRYANSTSKPLAADDLVTETVEEIWPYDFEYFYPYVPLFVQVMVDLRNHAYLQFHTRCSVCSRSSICSPTGQDAVGHACMCLFLQWTDIYVSNKFPAVRMNPFSPTLTHAQFLAMNPASVRTSTC
jgi:hypothetical protein